MRDVVVNYTQWGYRYFLHIEKNILISLESNSFKEIENKGYIELPKIPYQDKFNFLNLFLSENTQYKKQISDLIEKFTESSNFELQNEIKEIQLNLAYKFVFKSEKFQYDYIDRLYGAFNLNEDMDVEFW